MRSEVRDQIEIAGFLVFERSRPHLNGLAA
jgi:hypothetical protein